jgi:phospholipase C
MLPRTSFRRLSRRTNGLGRYRMMPLLFGVVALLLFGVTGSAQASAGATLTASAASVPNGDAITFTYTAPSSEASPYNVVAVIPADQPQAAGSVTGYESAPGTDGSVTFIVSSVGGVGSYYAYLANEETDDIYAGPVGFAVTKGTVSKAPAYDTSIGQQVLDGPYGVAVDSSGNVWASDTGHNAIAEFTASGRLIKEIGRGRLDHPEGIAIDSSGDIWAAVTGSNSVAEFSPSGTLLTTFGTEGSGNGELDGPDAVAVSGGTVYVADFGNNRIEEFTTSGTYTASISVPTPTGVAVSTAGDIWVASASYTYGNGIYEYAPSGARLLAAESTQSGYGSFGDTGGIAIGANGMVYVAQPDYGLVSVYTPGGSFSTEFGLHASLFASAENLEFPQAVAVTPDGRVWVADSGRNRLTEFGPATTNVGAGAASTAAPAAPAAPGSSRSPWAIALVLLAVALLGAAGVWLLRTARRRGAFPAGAPSPVAAAPVAAAGVAAAGVAEPAAAAPVPFAAPRVAEPVVTAPTVVSRRTLLTGATALSGIAAAGVLPVSLRRAIAATPPNLRGRLPDIQHIVILMQENRSFDHYFGTMPGVRGYQDPTAITLPSGKSVFYQPDPSHADGYLTPFHYNTRTTAAQVAPSLDHGWETQHQAWNSGAMDQWVPAKGPYTMGYYREEDIPFHWALAQAFTLCDNYHCSVFGPTDPNRLYMWTGMIDPNGKGGGPVISNAEYPPYTWTTYPERLQAAGITWQVYQEEDNYDDNALEWFKIYQNASSSSPLWQHGMQKRPAGWFEADARAGCLPQVSWLVAPSAQTEHPDYMPAAGAEYIAQKLDAIASNEELWRTTLFILTYDENDGYFDHVVPPTAPPGTPAEYVEHLPIGLGFRVPCTLISPWTTGGNIYSGVLDHTSLVRIIEARFGVREPNISAWRRKTCGDFTEALRFSGWAAGWPRQNQAISLAAAEAGLLTAQAEVFTNPRPTVPTKNEPIPKQ